MVTAAGEAFGRFRLVSPCSHRDRTIAKQYLIEAGFIGTLQLPAC